MKYIYNILAVSFFIMQLLLIIWGINKGFDLTDEGYTVLLLKQERVSINTLKSIEFLLNKWLGWADIDVIGYRILGIFITALSTIIFFLSFRKYKEMFLLDEMTRITPAAEFSILAFFNFYQFARSTTTLNHNIITNTIIVISAACLLNSLTNSPYDNKKECWVWQPFIFAIGFLMGIQYTVKSPVIIAFILVLYFFLYLHGKQKPIKFFLVITAYLLLGYALSYSIIRLFIRNATYSIGLETIYNYLFILLKKYQEELCSLISFIPFLVPSFLLGISFVMIYAKNNHGIINRYKKFVLIILCILCLASLVFLFTTQNITPISLHNSKKISFLFFGYIIFIISVWLINHYHVHKYNLKSFLKRGSYTREFLILIIFLLVLPFVAAFGTANPLFRKALHFALPLGALIVLIFSNLLSRNQIPLFPEFNLIVIIIWLGVQFSYNYIFLPYRLTGNRFEQKYQFSDAVPKGNGLLVSLETKETIDDIATTLYTKTNFQKGDPILDFYVMPGITYLVDGRSPIGLWTNPNLTDNICFQIKNLDIGSDKLFLLINHKLNNQLLACLNDAGVSFPRDFEKIGETSYSNQRDPKWNIIEIYVQK